MRHRSAPASLVALLVSVLAAGGCGDRPGETTTGSGAGVPQPQDTREESPMASQDPDHVVAVAYDGKLQELHVRLAAGVHRLGMVPRDVADALIGAKDRDAVYRERIRGKYPAEHLTPVHPAYDRVARALDAAEWPEAPEPPTGDPPADWEDPTSAPGDIGTATMLADGTLRMQLRSETKDGIAEALLVVKPGDARYDEYVEHLGGLKPGESRSIPPFPEPTIDPDSVR